MKTIELKLKEEKITFEKMVKEARKRLKVAPKGRLRIRKWNGLIEYY